MKIGTKANAIDDLGKFDGSEMTIKVDGKQIYPQKRYSIVRVDGKCPYHTTDKAFCIHQQEKRFCLECKIRDRYGDTKEQLVMKVAQVIKRVTNDGYVIAYKKFGTGYINTVLKNTDVAKEIVEFLGVEE